jgi:hypothetical protein
VKLKKNFADAALCLGPILCLSPVPSSCVFIFPFKFENMFIVGNYYLPFAVLLIVGKSESDFSKELENLFRHLNSALTLFLLRMYVYLCLVFL